MPSDPSDRKPYYLPDSRRGARFHFLPHQPSTFRAVGLCLLSLLIAAAVALWPAYPGLGSEPRWALFILVTAAGLWVTEAIPAFATSLLVIGMAISLLGHPRGEGSPEDWTRFLEPWGSPLIWLFFGGFVMAAGAAKTQLDHWMARQALARFGRKPALVMLGVMLVTAVLSMFMSNTATTTVMIAVLAPLLLKGTPERENLSKAMLLAIAFGANLGGMGTIIGTPPNAIAAGALASVEPVGFAEWMILGIPPAVLLLAIGWGYLLLRYLGSTGFTELEDLRLPEDDREPAEPIQKAIVVFTFVLTVGLWLSSPLHDIPTPVVSLLPTCLLTALGILGPEDIRQLPWDILLLIAGGLALGVAIEETGLATWIVAQLPVESLGPIGLALLITYLTVLLSNLMSNTATANLLVPIAIALASAGKIQLVVPLALSASAAMCLPISTPPNAIVYGAGRLSTRDLLAAGLTVGLIGPVVIYFWVRLAAGWL